MKLDPLINNSNDIVGQLINDVGQLALWLQAIGLLVIFWVITQIISLIYERKKKKKLDMIEEKLNTINKKLDKFISANKK